MKADGQGELNTGQLNDVHMHSSSGSGRPLDVAALDRNLVLD